MLHKYGVPKGAHRRAKPKELRLLKATPSIPLKYSTFRRGWIRCQPHHSFDVFISVCLHLQSFRFLSEGEVSLKETSWTAKSIQLFSQNQNLEHF